jgi:hypothetical protein
MPSPDEWDFTEDDEWYAQGRYTAGARHVRPGAPKPPPRRARDDDLRPDHGRRTSEFLTPEVHFTTGLHRTRSQGHTPAPNVTIYNTTRMDNESSPQVRTDQKGGGGSPRGRADTSRIPGAWALEDEIAELRGEIRKDARSRSRHEFSDHRHHSPDRSYEDKIKAALAEQKLKDLEDRLERERQEKDRQERYRHHSPDHHSYEEKIQLEFARQRAKDAEEKLRQERYNHHSHSPDRSYEEKIQLEFAKQRAKEAEEKLERERYRHHSPDRSYEEKIQLALAQQRAKEVEEKLEKERWDDEMGRREELVKRRMELKYIKDLRERELERDRIKRQEEDMSRDWELKREREDRDRERREIEEEKKRAAIIAENRAKMSREQREAEEARDKMLAKLEKERREQEEERRQILAEEHAKHLKQERDAEEQREKVLAQQEKKNRKEKEERDRIIAENTAKMEKEAREREAKARAMEEERRRIIAENEAKVKKQAEEARLAQQRAVDDYNKKKAQEDKEAEEQRQRVIYEYERKKVADADKEKRQREELMLRMRLEEEERKRKEKEEYDAFIRKQKEKEEEEKKKKAAQEKELEEQMRKRLAQFGFQDNQIQAFVNPEKASHLQQGMMPNNPLHQIAPPPPHMHQQHHHHSSHQIAIAPAPTYAKVHRSHLDVETLHYYDIPYEYDMVSQHPPLSFIVTFANAYNRTQNTSLSSAKCLSAKPTSSSNTRVGYAVAMAANCSSRPRAAITGVIGSMRLCARRVGLALGAWWARARVGRMLAWGICFSGTEDFGELLEEFWGVVMISFMFALSICTIHLSTPGIRVRYVGFASNVS